MPSLSFPLTALIFTKNLRLFDFTSKIKKENFFKALINALHHHVLNYHSNSHKRKNRIKR